MDQTMLDTDLARLSRRVDDLTDRSELTALVHRLGSALDGGDPEELRTIFDDDATARTPGGVARGIDAVVAQAGRVHSPEARIQHVISDVLVDLDRDRAEIRANLVVTFGAATDASRPRSWLGEVYRFGARRAPAGWRLTSVESELVWAAGAPVTGTVPAGAAAGRGQARSVGTSTSHPRS